MCQACGAAHGTARLMPPTVLEHPDRRTKAITCEAWPSCQNRELRGWCSDCNRWLCLHCSCPELPVHCNSCPFVLIPRGGITGMDLSIPAAIRQPKKHALGTLIVDSREAFEEQRRKVDDATTMGAELGRLMVGSWMPGSRLPGGQVARAGSKYAAIPLPAASSSSAPPPAASSYLAPVSKAMPSRAPQPAAASSRPPSPPTEVMFIGSPLSSPSVDWGD